jgi:DNA repair protein RadC
VAVILLHNHPSEAEPLQADQALNQSPKNVLTLLDIRVLDHLIVGGSDVLSLAQRGLI